jgi:hypothetical protein
MNFIDAINTVLKYGVAPSDMIQTGVQAAIEDAQRTDSMMTPTVHDTKLQDLLQEHDDPRELIVRNHRDRKETGRTVMDELTDRLGTDDMEIEQDGHHNFGHGQGWAYFWKYWNPQTGATLHRANWSAPSSRGFTRSYSALLDPEEMKTLRSRLLEHFPSQS